MQRSWSIVYQVLLVLLLAPPNANADLPTAADLAETREIRWSDPSQPALSHKASELGDAVSIYEFVRNEFEFALYDGARSTSTSIFANRRGNDVDLASTLIAMLRSAGIPARYATGTVNVSYAQAQNWLEIPHANRARKALQAAGFQNTGNSSGRTSFAHAWVQAFVSLDRYRGNDAASPVDCMATPGRCTWLNLDPSFKQRRYRDPSELVDVSETVNFPYTSYYRAEESSAYSQYREKNPLEIYEDKVLDHLQGTSELAGKTLEDVIYEGEIIREEHGILPVSTPFRFDPASVATYSSVDSHDADSSQFPWKKMVSFTVTFPTVPDLAGLTLTGGAPVPVAELADKNLTFSYESYDFSDPTRPKSLVARLGDAVHRTMFTLNESQKTYTSTDGNGTITGPLPDVSTLFDVTLSVDGNGTVAAQVLYPNLELGGHFLVAVGGEFSGFGEVRRSVKRLLHDSEQYPVLDDGTGVIYVDQNGDGQINPGEPMLLEDPATQRRLTGGVLAVAKDLYYAQLQSHIARAAKLQRTTMLPSSFLGIVSSVHDVRSLDGTAFSVTPVGLLVDMKGLSFTAPYRIDGNETNPNMLRLGGHIASSLEHEIWQELTGFEALSTVKGIQRAIGDGANLVELPEISMTGPFGPDPWKVDAALSSWGFNDLPGIPWSGPGFLALSLELFGHDIWFPWSFYGDQSTFSAIRFEITPENNELEKRGWDFPIFQQENGSGNTFGSWYERVFRKVYDKYTYFQSLDPLTPFFPYNLAVDVLGKDIGGCWDVDRADYAVAHLPNCFDALMDHPDLKSHRDYLDFFDRNQGFDPDEHRFRVSTEDDIVPAATLAPLLNELWLGADKNGNGVPDGNRTVELVMPGRLARGEILNLSVWIKRYYDLSGIEESAVYAINRAGGGFVSGMQTKLPALDFLNFDNERFTDRALVAATNNSPLSLHTGDPIATTTGNVFHDESDLLIKGRGGLDYLFTRTYNSGSTDAEADGIPIGHKWTHSYNVRLIARDYNQEPNGTIATNSDGLVSSVTYVDERGGEHIFEVSGSGPISDWTVTNPRGNFDSLDLTQGGSNSYTLVFRNGTEYVFGDGDLGQVDQTARLELIRDPYGNEVALGYDAGGKLTTVTDNLGIPGRTGLAFSYHPDGRLQQLSDWTGTRTWQYGYDAAGNLTSFTNPLGHTTKYGYIAGTHLLAEIERPADRDGDGKGDVITTFDYYENSRGFSNADAYEEGEQVSYDLFRKRTRITDPREFVMAHHYNTHGELTKLTERDGGIMTFAHNDDGRRTMKTDALGYATTFAYDTVGRLTNETDAQGNSIDYTYGLFDQILELTDKRGNTVGSSYFGVTNLSAGELRGKEGRRDVDINGSVETILRKRYLAGGNINLHRSYFTPDESKQLRTDLVYDASGTHVEKVEATVSGSTLTTEFTVDDLGRVTSATSYRRTSATDPTLLALTTAYAYDTLDRVVAETDPLGNVREIDFDENGNIVEERVQYKTGPDTYETRVYVRNEYDDADRLTRTLDIYGNATTFKYDAAGNLLTRTNANGHSTRFEYDEMGRRVAVEDENGHRVVTTYDLAGRAIAVTDPNGNAVSFAYDALGRLLSRTSPLGEVTQYQYDANGNLTGEIDANGTLNSYEVTLHHEYDELNRLVKTVNGEDEETLFQYDLQGNRTHVTDAEGRTTEFVFDTMGRLVEIIDPLVESPDKTQTFEYDEAGNLIVATDRNGEVTHFTYDAANRIERVDYLADGTSETYSYDVYGNLEGVSNGSVTYSYGYDLLNRVVSVTDGRRGLTLGYVYDAVGNVTQKTDYQGDITTLQYDGTNRLVSLTNPAYLQVSYQHDAAGRLLNRILSNGARTSYSYDADGRLTRLAQVAADGSVVSDTTYTYDGIGNIQTQDDGSGQIVYTYDGAYRLIGADYPGGAGEVRSYSYDRVGNRLTKTTAGGTVYYQYDSGNRLLSTHLGSGSGPIQAQYLYDDNGSVVEKRDGAGSPVLTFERDQKGEVSAITLAGSGVVNRFLYDPLGYRVEKADSVGTRVMMLENEHLESIYDGNGRLESKYLRGIVIDEVVNGYLYDGDAKPTNYTYHHDPVNSVVAVTGHAGATEEMITFAPFGEELSTSGASANPLRYTGRERDPDTGLYYYRARYYDPDIGRFLSEDPLGFDGEDVNFYVYARNRPLVGNDPLGLKINLTAHEVAFFGIGTGQAHFAIEVIPDDQEHWKRVLSRPDAPFRLQDHPNASGVKYFTISGSARGLPPTYKLELEFNKESDRLSKNFQVGEIGRPAGVSENQYIERLIGATQRYNANPVDYDILPEMLPGSGANSTGAAFGLVNATDGRLPNMATLHGGLGTAGSRTLVSRHRFGRTQRGQSGPTGYPSQSWFNLGQRAYVK